MARFAYILSLLVLGAAVQGYAVPLEARGGKIAAPEAPKGAPVNPVDVNAQECTTASQDAAVLLQEVNKGLVAISEAAAGDATLQTTLGAVQTGLKESLGGISTITGLLSAFQTPSIVPPVNDVAIEKGSALEGLKAVASGLVNAKTALDASSSADAAVTELIDAAKAKLEETVAAAGIVVEKCGGAAANQDNAETGTTTEINTATTITTAPVEAPTEVLDEGKNVTETTTTETNTATSTITGAGEAPTQIIGGENTANETTITETNTSTDTSTETGAGVTTTADTPTETGAGVTTTVTVTVTATGTDCPPASTVTLAPGEGKQRGRNGNGNAGGAGRAGKNRQGQQEPARKDQKGPAHKGQQRPAPPPAPSATESSSTTAAPPAETNPADNTGIEGSADNTGIEGGADNTGGADDLPGRVDLVHPGRRMLSRFFGRFL